MLKDFQELCDNKMVKKMPYDDWKTLKRMVKDNRYLYLRPAVAEKGDVAYSLFATKEWIHPHLFLRKNDESFGYVLDISWKAYPVNAIRWADDEVFQKFNDELSYYDIIARAEDNNMANDYLDCSATSTADAAKIADLSTTYSCCDAVAYSSANYESEYGSYYTTKTVPVTNWGANSNTVRIAGGDICCNRGDEISLVVDTKVDNEHFENEMKKMRAEIKMDKPMLNNEKEKNMFNFDFGSCADNHNIRMSMYGLAVKNRAGKWVSYDANSGQIMDVDILNFDSMNRYMYRVPVAIKDIAVGDVLIHNGRPVFVSEITEQVKIVAIDVIDGEEKIVMPLRNMFGFNYATKVVSLMDMCGAPCADQPFGNMWMLALADNKDFDPMMLMLMNGGKMDMSNPMMMYMLMKDNKSKDDILPLLMMMNMNK